MGWVVFVLVLLACAGGVVWNHKTAAAAMAGVEFHVAAPPAAVADAIHSAYCNGARAALTSMVRRVSVTPAGPTSFQSASSIGDAGCIEVTGDESGSTVRAYTTELYVGSHPSSHFRRGSLGIAATIVHGVYKMLGIAPNAGRMKRLNAGVEGRIGSQLRRSAAA